MRYSTHLLILLLSSVVLLEKWSFAQMMRDDPERGLLPEQDEHMLRLLRQRLIKRSSCPSPYHVLTPDGRCVWSCAAGTQPDDTTNECVCQSGYYQTSTDSYGRRVCSICPSPYHGVTSDGRCVWSCAAGTQPDDTTNECVCKAGYYQSSTDSFGRRVCSICPSPYHVLTSDGRCVWSCAAGTQPDSTTNECVCQSGYYQTSTDSFGRRVCSICPSPYHVLTSDGRCVWSCAAGTQPDDTTNECVCQSGYYQTSTDSFGRRVCSICPSPYHVLTSDGRCVWSCAAGTQPDDTTNECVCKPGYYKSGTDSSGRRVCSLLIIKLK